MARVARARDMQPQVCMVSSPIWPIGTRLWVYGEHTQVLLHCTVVDVSHPRDVKRHLRTRRLIELSYEVTEKLCKTTKGSSAECPVLIIKLE